MMGKGPSRVSSRLKDGLLKNKKSFQSLKERPEIQKDREFYTNTDDLQYITFLKCGIRRDCNE